MHENVIPVKLYADQYYHKLDIFVLFVQLLFPKTELYLEI